MNMLQRKIILKNTSINKLFLKRSVEILRH